jgi:hypothetical protein
MRAEWGCDEPARQDVFRTTCPVCSGGNPDCTRCEGSGTAGYRRCPQSMVDAETRSLMQTYAAYKAGFLPAPGGWMDQARGWVRAIGVVEAEIGVIEAKREAQRKARANKGGG